MTPAQKKALKDYEDTIKAYSENPQAQYTSQGHIVNEDLGNSAMGDVTTDPKYKEHELAALRELEDQSKNGFTASDRADMARVETSVNRANRGRIGAIQQNMLARGMGGSGMELVANLQSSQDANEIAAMKALEQEGMIQDRKSQATRDLGGMSASLQSRDFAQAAEKARAKDAIAQFNNANRNNANRVNLSNDQNVSNLNVGSANDFSQNKMTANAGLATMGYNAATEEENRRLLAEEERRRQKAAKKAAGGAMIGGIIGAGAGFAAGGPAGASVGYGMGSSFGQAAGSYAHGGKVPGEAEFPGDDERNDTVTIKVSPGEMIIPRTKVDAVQDLLKAVARLNKKNEEKK